MKKRVAVPLLLLTLLLAAIGIGSMLRQEEDTDRYAVYFPRQELSNGGDAVCAEYIAIPSGETVTAQELAAALIGHLIAGPDSPELCAFIPSDTELHSVSLDGQRAVVDLSASYARLSGIRLSLADYCITLTLTQLEQISSVRITVLGQDLTYRDRQVLFADDALLHSTEDAVRTFRASLYFLDSTRSALCSETRVITLLEGERRAEKLLEALCAGPNEEGLEALLPQGFSILSVRSDDGVCYVNISGESEALLPENAVAQRMLLESIVRTICALDDTRSVQFLIDGEVRTTFGLIPVGMPLSPEELYR